MAPIPAIHPAACGDSVCLTIEDTRALAGWIVDVSGLQDALKGCPLVAPKAE